MWVILSTVGLFSTVWDIINTVGVILNNVGNTQCRGGYHDLGDITSTMRVFSTVGENLLLFEYPMVLMICSTCIMISPLGTQITRDGIPHSSEHPTVLMISTYGTEYPPQYSR